MSDLICFISPIKFFKDCLEVFCLLVAFAAGILINERLGLPGKVVRSPVCVCFLGLL